MASEKSCSAVVREMRAPTSLSFNPAGTPVFAASPSFRSEAHSIPSLETESRKGEAEEDLIPRNKMVSPQVNEYVMTSTKSANEFMRSALKSSSAEEDEEKKTV